MPRARVLGAVDAMTETGDRLARFALRPHIIGSARGIADLFRHLHHVFRGATVRGARQSGNCRRDRGVQVGLGADHNARRERGGIRSMLGMQDEVAVDELRGVATRLGSRKHPQQVGRMRKPAVGGYRFESLADARMRGDDHGDLRGQADALTQRSLARDVGDLRIERRERGGGGAQHVHRMGGLHHADDVVDRLGQAARRLEVVVEGGELPRVRQLAIEQQPRGFLEARMFSEIVDGIAAVAQVARLAVDERARRAIEVDAFQAAVNLDCFGCFGH